MNLLAQARQRLAGFIAPPVNPFAGAQPSASATRPPVVQAARALRADLPADLARLIRPEATMRWGLLPQIGSITPRYLEMTLRNAMAGAHVAQWELFDLMKDTWPRLLKNDNELKRGAMRLLANWQIEADCDEGETPTPEALDRVALVKRAMKQMRAAVGTDENGWDGTLYDLADAWTVGTTVLEVLDWQMVKSDMLPRATVWVHPKHYAWGNSGFLGLAANVSGAGNSLPAAQLAGSVVPFPANKFLVAICKAKTGHPLSGALLRPLAWWWCAANFSADWLLNFAQIFGTPIRWGHYPPGTSEETINRICEMLQNMGSSAWAAFPEGVSVELKESSKGAAGSLPQESVLDRADKQCDLLLLRQTLTSDTGDAGHGGGSLALGKVHAEGKQDVIAEVAAFNASVLNEQLIPMLLTVNYGNADYAPRFVPPKEEEDAAEAAQAYGTAVTAGALTPCLEDEEHFRSKLNLPPMSPEVVAAWKTRGVGAAAPSPAPSEGPKERTEDTATVQAAGGSGSCAHCGKPVTHVYPWRTSDRKPLHEECADVVLFGKVAQAAAAPDGNAIATTLHETLLPLIKRLEAIAKVDDAAIQQHLVEKLLRDLPSIAEALKADPSLAHKLNATLAPALQRGLTTQP